MANITEKLTLVDEFSSVLTSYIQLTEQAAAVTEKITGQTETAADEVNDLADTLSDSVASLSEAAQQADTYAEALETVAEEVEETAHRFAELNTNQAAAEKAAGKVSSLVSAATRLGNAAGTASGKLTEFTQKISSGMTAGVQKAGDAVGGLAGKVTSFAQSIVTKIRESIAPFDEASHKIEKLSEKITDADRNALKFAGSQEMANNAMKKGGDAADELGDKLKQLFGIVAIIQAVKGLIELTDTTTQTTARIDRMNDGLQTTAELQDMIMASAQRSRGAYQDTADMVGKLGTLAGDAFNSTQEIVFFVEQLNKQFALSGASAQGQAAAMLQLTQAMSSGVLRGEELNSILEQAPTITKSIADYLGVSIGEMRDLAKEGKITSDVVKAAVSSAAAETDAAFEQIPLTWEQMWVGMKNVGLEALQPLLDALQEVPQMIADNWDSIEPVLMGIAVAIGVVTVATLAQAAAQWAANTAMFASPLTWIAVGLAALVVGIYAAVEAWNDYADDSVSAMGVIVGVFATAGAFILNSFIVPIQRQLATLGNFIFNVFQHPLEAVQILFLDMATTVLGYIQSVAQGIEDLLNALPGINVNITGFIDKAYNAVASTSANIKSEHGLEDHFKAWDYFDLADVFEDSYNWGANTSDNLSNFFGGKDTENAFDASTYLAELPDIAADTKNIAKSVAMSEEDIKSLVDMAERQYINQINLTAQSPVINVSGQNTGDTEQDRQALADAIKELLTEQMAAGSIRSTAAQAAG